LLHAAVGLVAVLMASTLAAAPETVVIGFDKFSGASAPKGVVTKWTNDSSAPNYWWTDDGPGGVSYPDAPKAIKGKQVAGFGNGGNGVTVGTMYLNTREGEANYSLASFHWAYRGNGNSRPGGDAYLDAGQVAGKGAVPGGA